MRKRPPLLPTPAERPFAPPLIVPTSRPRLLLRPAAFLKLSYLCHAADTEVGGFGLSSPEDPLTIEDALVVKQSCTAVTVEFDDSAIADLVDTMADQGVSPNRCTRVWMHTHPGSSASPSGTDERTFARSFGGADFSVMLILARGGQMYARLQLIGTVKAAVEIPVLVDWSDLPEWLNSTGQTLPELIGQWRGELDRLVSTPVSESILALGCSGPVTDAADPGPSRYPSDWLDRADLEDELLAAYEEAADEHDYGF